MNTIRISRLSGLFLPILITLLLFPTSIQAKSEYTTNQLRIARQYLKTELNLNRSDYKLTKGEFNKRLNETLLEEKREDIPLIEWVLSFDQSDRVYENMKENQDLMKNGFKAFKEIGEFAICEVFTGLPPTSWPDLAAKSVIKGICKLRDVNRFKEVAVRNASEDQLDRYITAREKGFTHEEILEGKNIYSPHTLLFDQGWIISVGDTAKPIVAQKPGVKYNEPDDFYEYARIIWQAKENKSSYEELKKAIRSEVREALIRSSQLQLTLSGGQSPDDKISVDDDLTVLVDSSVVFADKDGWASGDDRGATYNGEPITFSANRDSTLTIVAYDTCCCNANISALYLHRSNGDYSKLTGRIDRSSEGDCSLGERSEDCAKKFYEERFELKNLDFSEGSKGK